jgi:hypothetical protein
MIRNPTPKTFNTEDAEVRRGRQEISGDEEQGDEASQSVFRDAVDRP